MMRGSYMMVARSVAKDTDTETIPGWDESAFSMEETQEPHLIDLQNRTSVLVLLKVTVHRHVRHSIYL